MSNLLWRKLQLLLTFTANDFDCPVKCRITTNEKVNLSNSCVFTKIFILSTFFYLEVFTHSSEYIFYYNVYFWNMVNFQYEKYLSLTKTCSGLFCFVKITMVSVLSLKCEKQFSEVRT